MEFQKKLFQNSQVMNFHTFAKQWDFNHITFNPDYSKFSGLAERTTQTEENSSKMF